MNKYIRIASVAAAAAALLCACSRELNPQAEPEYVEVPFELSIADVPGDATRATTALFPENENWIYDYYYIQFIGDASAYTGHMRKTVTTGDLTVTENIRLRVGANSTVIFVANIVPAGSNYVDSPGWDATDGSVQILDENGIPFLADNENGVLTLNKFKKLRFNMNNRLVRIQASDNSMKHMPMCGYWEGNVAASGSGTTNTVPATVTMGRMVSRMNVNITNKTGSPITQVRLLNTAAKAYYFPQVENTDLTADDYITLSQNVNIANNNSATVYFYTAPNYCEGNGLHTKLEFTAGGKTGTVDLGSDVPNDHYNLYMNTIYTFNITVK